MAERTTILKLFSVAMCCMSRVVTDIDILRELSRKIGHRASELWDERINAYYTRNNNPGADIEAVIEGVERGFGMKPDDHFDLLQGMISNLRGLAILDSDDDPSLEDFEDGNLRVVYWRRYEIENYFVTPETIQKCIDDKWPLAREIATEILDNLILEQVFSGNDREFAAWKSLDPNKSRERWDELTAKQKLSDDFAEEFFRRLHKRKKYRMLLRKGTLYQLIQYVDADSIDPEVSEKLDLLADIFEHAKSRDENHGAELS